MEQLRRFAPAINQRQRTISAVIHVQRLLLGFTAIKWMQAAQQAHQHEILPAMTMIEHRDQLAAGFEHAIDLVDQWRRIGNVMQHAHRADDIECRVGIR